MSEQQTFSLSDKPCALCKVPTVQHVLFLERARVPCCDSCAANLTDARRMLLLEAAATLHRSKPLGRAAPTDAEADQQTQHEPQQQ